MRTSRLSTYDIEIQKRSLLEYIQASHHAYQANWFHKAVCAALEQFYADCIAGLCPRLMLFAPPRHGKSEIVSRYFPSWILGKNPDMSIIGTSYAASLASSMCRDIQRIMSDDAYKQVFPFSALGKKNIRTVETEPLKNSEIFEIAGHRGFYKSAGVGGGITGLGADIAIIDDPFKDHQEAYSETIRENVWNWYLTTLSTRLSPIGGILIINTRWHQDDLCGRILEQEPEKWKVLSFQGLAEHDEDFRKTGEALHPERYSTERLNQIRASIGENFFAAMYQQNPVAGSGNLFTREMFTFGPVPKEQDYSYITMDTAYNDKKENDDTAMMAGKVRNDILYIDKVYKKKIKAEIAEVAATGFINSFVEYGFRGAYIEPKGHGIYLNQVLPKKGVVMPTDTDIAKFFKDRNLNKVERANNVLPYLANRKIVINELIPNKDEILNEILAFPKAKHDDVTDCFIDMVKLVFARGVNSFDWC